VVDAKTARQVALNNVRAHKPTTAVIVARLLRELHVLAEVRKHLKRNGVLLAEEWQALTGEDIRV
jgi:hypothetical protein